MIAGLKISMITKCNMATINKFVNWWYDSGATVHVYNDKNMFKSYEVVAKEDKILMKNYNTSILPRYLEKGLLSCNWPLER